MNVLVVNCGSSSLKFSVIDVATDRTLAHGVYAALGSSKPYAALLHPNESETKSTELPCGAAHSYALDSLAGFLENARNSGIEISAVGHRVVHGGEQFTEATLIDQRTIDAIEACNSLAPLHNPSNALGIRKAIAAFPNLTHVAIFDTAFHQTLSKEAYLYAIPYELYRAHGIRRYGFHGTSHKFVSREAARIIGKPIEETGMITVHLGNGCSAAAIEAGNCVDTTMGLTPLEGLVMGTRSGDIDPGIVFHLHRALGWSIDRIDTVLNSQSGLLGLSQSSNDMRSLREAADSGDERATLAIRIFVRRLAKAIAALRSTIHSCDALVFTGGIGENDPRTRAATLEHLEHLGFRIDPEANRNARPPNSHEISKPGANSVALVVPTNEELMIARETAALISEKRS